MIVNKKVKKFIFLDKKVLIRERYVNKMDDFILNKSAAGYIIKSERTEEVCYGKTFL
jgi:hypothetical protein